jgi:hypothetical protein
LGQIGGPGRHLRAGCADVGDHGKLDEERAVLAVGHPEDMHASDTKESMVRRTTTHRAHA